MSGHRPGAKRKGGEQSDGLAPIHPQDGLGPDGVLVPTVEVGGVIVVAAPQG